MKKPFLQDVNDALMVLREVGAVLVGLVRARLDELLPEPLADVLGRESAQREALRVRLAELKP